MSSNSSFSFWERVGQPGPPPQSAKPWYRFRIQLFLDVELTLVKTAEFVDLVLILPSYWDLISHGILILFAKLFWVGI